MSLRPQPPLPPVPGDTARVTRAAFQRGNPYVLLRDRLGAVFADNDFADLYPAFGQPAYAPWRLALVTLLQFREGLSDRQAAEAVRARIDWKYLLALGLDDPGFDHSVLCEFRGRLLDGDATGRLLARVLDVAREGGLLRPRGRQRTNGTHVLAAIRVLNRLELAGETLRAALNAVAAVAPDWLRGVAPPDWHDRYDRRVEDARLPAAGPKRDAHADAGHVVHDKAARDEGGGAKCLLHGVAPLSGISINPRQHASSTQSASEPNGTIVTMRVLARCQARACARESDILPAPVWQRGPPSLDRRPTCPARDRDHRRRSRRRKRQRTEPSRVDRRRS